MKHLDESAHVSAFVLMGQIDIHIDGGNGVLRSVAPIANRDRISQIFDTDLINRKVAIISLILNVFHSILEDNLSSRGSLPEKYCP